jgi:hypothetical protein
MERAWGELRDNRVTLRESRPRLRTASSRIGGASRGSSGASRGSRRASCSADRAAHASSRAPLRACGAAVGADKDAFPNAHGICRSGRSIRLRAEGRRPKTSSVDTKTNGSSASSESCGSKTDGIPAHDHGVSPCVLGSPTSPDRFRCSSLGRPTCGDGRRRHSRRRLHEGRGHLCKLVGAPSKIVERPSQHLGRPWTRVSERCSLRRMPRPFGPMLCPFPRMLCVFVGHPLADSATPSPFSERRDALASVPSGLREARSVFGAAPSASARTTSSGPADAEPGDVPGQGWASVASDSTGAHLVAVVDTGTSGPRATEVRAGPTTTARRTLSGKSGIRSHRTRPG